MKNFARIPRTSMRDISPTIGLNSTPLNPSLSMCRGHTPRQKSRMLYRLTEETLHDTNRQNSDESPISPPAPSCAPAQPASVAISMSTFSPPRYCNMTMSALSALTKATSPSARLRFLTLFTNLLSITTDVKRLADRHVHHGKVLPQVGADPRHIHTSR